VEQIAGAAEGRIFAGNTAKELHLVDEWGGIEQAIVAARQLAKLDENVPVRLAGETGGILEWFDDDDGASDDSRASGWLGLAKRAAGVPDVPGDMLSGGAAAFLGSLGPLVTGERTLTALPFALLLR
jgi:protease IV